MDPKLAYQLDEDDRQLAEMTSLMDDFEEMEAAGDFDESRYAREYEAWLGEHQLAEDLADKAYDEWLASYSG